MAIEIAQVTQGGEGGGCFLFLPFWGTAYTWTYAGGVGQKMPCATSLCTENEGGKGAEGQVPPPCAKVSAHGSISSADHFMTPAAGVHILLLMSSRPVQQS